MIPLSDNVPTRRFPAVCVVLIAVNVLVFLVDSASAVRVSYVTGSGYEFSQVMGGLSHAYALVPAYVTGAADHGALIPLSVHPAWLTVFTSMFLHSNWLHIGGNMLYLWIFGNNVEDAIGPLRFIVFYLACGVGAAALQIASDPASGVPVVGASGAIAGLMGAYLIVYPGARILSLVPLFGCIGTLAEVPAVIVIGFWFLIQIINGSILRSGGVLASGGGVAYLAHVGGFVAGIVLILALGGRRLAQSNTRYAG